LIKFKKNTAYRQAGMYIGLPLGGVSFGKKKRGGAPTLPREHNMK
jgi:hypothetical protein